MQFVIHSIISAVSIHPLHMGISVITIYPFIRLEHWKEFFQTFHFNPLVSADFLQWDGRFGDKGTVNVRLLESDLATSDFGGYHYQTRSLLSKFVLTDSFPIRLRYRRLCIVSSPIIIIAIIVSVGCLSTIAILA